jgi:hypothetical protein
VNPVDAASLPIEHQKQVFAALIAAQDNGTPEWTSWELVARQFDIDLATVSSIQEAGIVGRWWPLTYCTLTETVTPILDWLEQKARELDSVGGDK